MIPRVISSRPNQETRIILISEDFYAPLAASTVSPPSNCTVIRQIPKVDTRRQLGVLYSNSHNTYSTISARTEKRLPVRKKLINPYSEYVFCTLYNLRMHIPSVGGFSSKCVLGIRQSTAHSKSGKRDASTIMRHIRPEDRQSRPTPKSNLRPLASTTSVQSLYCVQQSSW